MGCQIHKGWQLQTRAVNKQTDINREQQTNRHEDGYNLLLKQMMFRLSLVPIYNVVIISTASYIYERLHWIRKS